MTDLLWTRTIPVLSTAHITHETIRELRAQEYPPEVLEYSYGIFLAIGDDPAVVAGYPQEIQPVIAWFHTHFPGESWIAFDRDGDEIDDLPTYEW
jgi:hypothetical protein